MSEDIKKLIKEKSDKGVLRLVMNNLDYKNALSNKMMSMLGMRLKAHPLISP